MVLPGVEHSDHCTPVQDLQEGGGQAATVGVAPTMVRLLDKFAAVQYRQVLQGYLEPQQLALSPAGGHKLVHIVRMVMEAHKDWMWR